MRRPSRRLTAITATAALAAPLWALAGPAIAAPPADTTPPTVSNVLVTPSPVVAGLTVVLTALASDTQPGKIASASYTVNGGAAVAMANASPDGMWQNKDEEVTAAISGLGAGSYNLCITATDDSGNVSVAAACTSLTVNPAPPPADTTPPLVSNVDGPSSVPVGDPATITADASDLTTGNSTLSGAEYQVDGGSWIAMPAADGTFDEVTEALTVTFSTAGFSIGNHDVCVRATDLPGNTSAGADADGDCEHFNVNASGGGGGDTTRPTVTINQAALQADPTSSLPIAFTVTFSEPVNAFDSSDVTLGGTAPGASAIVTGGPTVYTVSVTVTGSGTVTASIPADAAADPAGNLSEASTSSDNIVTYDAPAAPDTTAPTVTINQAVSQNDPTNAQPIVFDVTFSEPVVQYQNDLDDFVISGPAGATGTIGDAGDADAQTYTVSVSGMTADGLVSVTVPAGAAFDAAGNASEASTSTDNSVLYDTTGPSVTVNQGAAQADPTSIQPIAFDVMFSESVTGFDAADVVLGGTATGSTAHVAGSGANYTVTVDGITADGTVIATIAGGAVSDALGNASSASTSTDNTVTYDDADFAVAVSDSAVNQGETVTMSASLTDAGGIATDVTADTVFSSSVATDVIAGALVTFPTASPHTITGTHTPSGDIDSVLVEVTPQEVAPVDLPPADGDNGGAGGVGGEDTDDDDTVAGEFLPSTGAAGNPIALGLAGLVIVGAGAVVRRVARRRELPPVL